MKESWRKKLHLAKLAAWMKAKAEIEASDLASSLAPLMLPTVKNIDDYDTLPRGKRKSGVVFKTGSIKFFLRKRWVRLSLRSHAPLTSG